MTKIYDQWCVKPTASGNMLDDWDITYTYDNNGTLKSSQCQSSPNCEGYTGSAKTYTYDAWGRLTNFSDSLGETASYSYYSDGLRASKTIGSNTTKYYYDGDSVINETLNGNSYATNVVGVDGYISRKQNSTTGYLFKNAHGDVLAAYSSTTNKLADYSYTAWGEQQSVNETSSFTNNPLRYCGEYYDYESGMTYLRARYYDSNIKRFISEDPIKDGLNWYSYAGNNPVMFVDPSGLVNIPNGGINAYNDLINCLVELMHCKVNYMNEDAKGENANKTLLNSFRADANRVRDYKISYNSVLWEDSALTNIIKKAVLDEDNHGTLREISSVIAVIAVLRENVISSPASLEIGDEIYPEDEIWSKYLKYASSDTIYIPYTTGYSISGEYLAQLLLSNGMWRENYFDGNSYSGYDAYGNKYFVQLTSAGSGTFAEPEDWWESLD